jgi:hypothetical protein
LEKPLLPCLIMNLLDKVFDLLDPSRYGAHGLP